MTTNSQSSQISDIELLELYAEWWIANIFKDTELVDIIDKVDPAGKNWDRLRDSWKCTEQDHKTRGVTQYNSFFALLIAESLKSEITESE